MVKRKKVVTDLSRRKIRTESIDLAQLVEGVWVSTKSTLGAHFLLIKLTLAIPNLNAFRYIQASDRDNS